MQQEAIFAAGKNGLFFANDTADLSTTGHGTFFTEETVLMQVPVADGIVPPYSVLYDGDCRGSELVQ